MFSVSLAGKKSRRWLMGVVEKARVAPYRLQCCCDETGIKPIRMLASRFGVELVTSGTRTRES